MPRIAYVNGRYMPHRQAEVHIEDRGYQFADGVYEVCEVLAGKLVDERLHLDRLERSLSELRIAWPMHRASLGVVLREVVARNGVVDGIVYLQITRGVAPRDHAFPGAGVQPALVVTARSMPMAARDERAAKGVSVVSVPDNRWGRVDIKTIGLLPNVLARQAAREAGAYEAWFVDAHGNVTEGSSTNAWIVSRDGQLLTRPADHAILRGVTRTVIIKVAANAGMPVVERAFSLQEARDAREAFLTSATSAVTPVISLDGQPIGDGRPGPLSLRLRAEFRTGTE